MKQPFLKRRDYSGLLPLALGRPEGHSSFASCKLANRELILNTSTKTARASRREALAVLVEAAGLEPASENHQPAVLHV